MIGKSFVIEENRTVWKQEQKNDVLRLRGNSKLYKN